MAPSQTFVVEELVKNHEQIEISTHIIIEELSVVQG